MSSTESLSANMKVLHNNSHSNSESDFSSGTVFKSPPPFQLKASSGASSTTAEVAKAAVKDAGFGIKLDHDSKKIVILANIYTTSATAHAQAQKAAATWNAKMATVEEYQISFDLNVISADPVSVDDVVKAFATVDFYNRRGKLRRQLLSKYRSALIRINATNAAENDPIGKSYSGNDGMFSRNVAGESFVGGQTANGKHADMNTHSEKGDLGENNDFVVHEFGHFFGLDDEDGDKDGKTDLYYPGDGGTMEYTGMDLHDISEADIEMILTYAKDILSSANEENPSSIQVVETVGTSDGNNPLGLKSKSDE